MTSEIRAYVDAARGDLAAARRDLAAGDPRHAVARAYYAAFHAAGAALASERRAAKSHAGTRALFSDLFIRTGRLDGALGRTLATLMDLRQQADYHVGGVSSAEEGETAVADATAFVDAVEEWLTSGPA